MLQLRGLVVRAASAAALSAAAAAAAAVATLPSTDETHACLNAATVHLASAPSAAAAATSLDDLGVAVLCGVVEAIPSTSTEWARYMDLSGTAASAGALAAACLPTIHQADAWVRTSMGEQLGRRAAAFAFQAAGQAEAVSAAGCAEAVAQLAPHATRTWPKPKTAASPWRVLSLQRAQVEVDDPLGALLAGAADELSARPDGMLREKGLEAVEALASVADRGEGDEADVSPLDATSPAGSLLRSWCAVLVSPARRWDGVVTQRCALHAEEMVQSRVQLIVPSGGGECATDGESVGGELMWPCVGAPDGFVVLLPLPSVAAAQEGADAIPPATTLVEVLLPSSGSGHVWPALRIELPAGTALALDGRTRWRLAAEGTRTEAYVLFEYRPRCVAVDSALLPSALQAAAARARDGVSLISRAAIAALLPPVYMRPSASIDDTDGTGAERKE